MLVIACAGAPEPATQSGRLRPAIDHSDTKTAAKPLEDRIRSVVRQWEGTPHKLGGTNRKGVDCSGFVQQLYREVFSHEIPRSTALQVESGRSVSKSRLFPGDLVFFKITGKGRHVGIYLGKNEFAHASTSRGVTIARLDDPYWQECYWTSRRYLDL